MQKVKSQKLGDIAKIIDGELSRGSKSDLLIDSIAPSPDLSTSSDLVFIYEERYLKKLPEIKAKAFILPKAVQEKLPELSASIIWVSRPRLVMKKILEHFGPPRFKPKEGVHETAVIDSTAKISKKCFIGANVFIGSDSVVEDGVVINANVYVGANVVVGKNSLLYPNVTVYDYSKIGQNVIVHSGTVIGSDGYSYVTEEESNLEKAKKGNFNFNFGRQIQHKIPSIGGVIIEDDVEIGANSCIDAGTIRPTLVGCGTKVDNLVQIAHNCQIGKDCLIVGQVGFAGSVTTGDRVVVGGQCGFADNLEIGNDVICVARSAVHGNVPTGSVYMGVPAVPYMEYFRNEKTLKRLPKKTEKLEGQIKELEAKVKELEAKLQVKA